MGMDQGLNKRVYIGANYGDHNLEMTVEISKNGSRVPVDTNRVVCIVEEVLRLKGNYPIHEWLSHRISDWGIENSVTYTVPTYVAEELLETIEATLSKPEDVQELFPAANLAVRDKFFLEELKDIKEALEEALAEDFEGEFEYWAWW